MEAELKELKRDLLNLDPDDEKANIDLNKRLIDRFPFLACTDKDTLRGDDFSRTWLDYMPRGWKRSIGLCLCEELREEIIRIDRSLLNVYRVSQVKEKFGRLKWRAVNYSDQMEDILTKYEIISMYTCVSCGKINVPVFDDGMISPFCKDCFKTYSERDRGTRMTDEEAETFIVRDAKLSRDTIIIRRSQNRTVHKKIDFSNTLKKLGVDPKDLPDVEEVITQEDRIDVGFDD